MNISISEYREKALSVLEGEIPSNSYFPIDYLIDSAIREFIGLPKRPQNDPPYEGWIVGEKSNFSQFSKISKKGENLIKRWEGCRLQAYYCSANILTIGWGHTKGVKKGDKITQEQADLLFQDDIKVYEQAVSQLAIVSISQNQYDALTSFCYNVGVSAFASSTLLSLVNERKYDAASKQFFRWVLAGGRKIQGLVNRRQEEHNLFVL